MEKVRRSTIRPLQCANWFFGRGLSIACNLRWGVPIEWSGLSREEKIRQIKVELRREMAAPGTDPSVIRDLLRILENNTTSDWKHYFLTTNWDYLLQKEISDLKLKVLPSWLKSSHVYHLNGTVEVLPDNSNRSPFLLEEDPASERCWTVEANVAYNNIISQRLFIVVGMSFECDTDKFLLTALNRVQDDLPIGESTWFVLNSNKSALDLSCQRLGQALPCAKIEGIHCNLQSCVVVQT